LATGANLVSVDLSEAVEANFANNGTKDNFFLAQADAFRLPVRRSWFDYVFCFGVLQHTPNPDQTFRTVVEYAKPGGGICMDVYPKDWRAYVHWKYYLRPFTKRVDPELLYRIVKRVVPALMTISTPLGRIPRIGRHLQRLIPVSNISCQTTLPYDRLVEWAILDTFDWFSPTYDSPQSMRTLQEWVRRVPLEAVEIFQRGFFVIRGRKASTHRPSSVGGPPRSAAAGA
jgi:SAM-dependent methyltransferase